MPNRGGFSWKRLSGYSAAKSRISRKTGIPFTRSGRQRKIGRLITGGRGGCVLSLVALALLLATIACGSTGATTPSVPARAPSVPVRATSVSVPAETLPPAKSQPTATQPQIAGPTANTGANLRAGPGTNYAKTGGAAAGQALNIIARNPAGDWYQLASGAWIFATLVANAPTGLPVANNIPVAPLLQQAAPTARGLPTAAGSTCDCDHGNTLNCDDFEAWDAQACYLRCKEITSRDVHGLDRDSDGSACEWEY